MTRAALDDFFARLESAAAPSKFVLSAEPPEEIPPEGIVIVSEDAGEPEIWIGGGAVHSATISIACIMPQGDHDEVTLKALVGALYTAAPDGTILDGGGVVEAWSTVTFGRERVESGESMSIARMTARVVWTSSDTVM